ncbi:MAG: DUF6324 family protein [Alphaproteobacteria bacterium]|nr:DUF6324 family protein [Alphaproteobacteria bacterium]
MGINTQSELAANLTIGPTDQGMVRFFVETDKHAIPMDFTTQETEEIIEELTAALKIAKTHQTGGA